MAFSHLLDQLGGDPVFDAVDFRLIRVIPAAHFPIGRLALGQALAAVGDVFGSIRVHPAAVPEIGLVGGEFFRAAGHEKLVGGLCLQSSLYCMNFVKKAKHFWLCTMIFQQLATTLINYYSLICGSSHMATQRMYSPMTFYRRPMEDA